ncbi:transcriptional regulator, XRE family [Rhodovulum sp. PH10]|uniref:helix-turn-helix domain-containing protein n=1 Tax=Rhodovulum sp. PH10 TaxID=1187851 RepID=UPI00027C2936|nr:helix-turn-helix transcriptional regulator [Rhodovulum sp. PH10]EJW11266.1 transcriptional regulator, XRE family [Rhodovulum sp. PH10]
MGKPQIIETEAGEIVVMSRADYDELVRRAGPTEAEEDAGTARIVAERCARLTSGEETTIPHEVVVRMDAENPVLVLREWRGLTQRELAEAVGTSQGYLSDLENGRRTGSPDVLARIARHLGVPLDLLV